MSERLIQGNKNDYFFQRASNNAQVVMFHGDFYRNWTAYFTNQITFLNYSARIKMNLKDNVVDFK